MENYELSLLFAIDMPEESALEVIEMLCCFISSMFKYISTQPDDVIFKNEVVVKGIIISLQSLLARDTLRKVDRCHHRSNRDSF